MQSKLGIPPLPSRFTARPRVAGALAGAAGTICVLQAPAGYGKTTAAIESLGGEEPDNIAWLSVDRYDSTELRFWAHVAAAIGRVRPGFFEAIAEAGQRSRGLDEEHVVASLLATLHAEDQLVLVLDDLHHLTNPVVWEQLAFFLERLPPGIRAVITTRGATPLPLERWQSQGRAFVIDEKVLRFDSSEAGGLIAGVQDSVLSDGEVADLVSRSEGWAVGLLFEALTIRRTGEAGATGVRRPRPSRTVINYLNAEVLDTLDDDDRDFLLSLSVLDEFDNELCRSITGEADAGMRLRSLRVANLFLVPVDEEAGRFRFHHLFRELLLEELDHRDPDLRIALHQRAAAVAQASGDVPVQIRHLLDAGDHLAAFDVMVSHVQQAGSLATAGTLVASFPSEFVLDDPERMLEFALVNSLAGDWKSAVQWCDRAEALLAEDAGPLRARLEFHRAIFHAGNGEIQAALDAAERGRVAAARDAPDDLLLRRFSTLIMARIDVFLTQDRHEAARWLDEARLLPKEFYNATQITIPALSAFLEFWSGAIEGAERLARQSLAAADQLTSVPSLPTLDALLALADILLESGRVDEAAGAVERAERVADQLRVPAYLVHVALRRIELTASTEGPAAGADAAARECTVIGRQHLGASLTDALQSRHAYWLLAEGRSIEASAIIDSLPPCPPTSILKAKLAGVERRNHQVAMILADAEDWFVTQRLEAQLLIDATAGYRHLPEILAGARGYVWTVVKQGQPLLRHLGARSTQSTPAVDLVLEGAAGFSEAFLPAQAGGAGGHLTDRERALLQLLPSHMSYADIAAELFISVNTVKSNLKSLYRKLDASSRSEAVERARAIGVG